MNDRNTAEVVAETYYDSVDADRFYETVWGGEDIHIGLYEAGMSIFEASRKTVETMASMLGGINAESRVLDLGSGYGGSARFLAKQFGCRVTCLNLSDVQNTRNKQLCEEQGLGDAVRVEHGSFESIPFEQDSYDVIWSQDAFLHSGRRKKVLLEISRVLKKGGELIFTDPMQADDCPPDVLQPVYGRLNLESLASFAFYRQNLEALGFHELDSHSLTSQLRNHYFEVGEQLKRRAPEFVKTISGKYIDDMLSGLQNWVKAADAGHLAWGILHFRKPE
ncbi:MAG: cyclopropane fatty-acyl-phospholipid synthase-like methyltransferase [Granulosicoccus sp.]|jgi:cyclopropane fatty-acyl-phospholipid synthase-like methyltransferase